MDTTIDSRPTSASDTFLTDLTNRAFHPALSWRSIVAGLLISLFAFLVFTTLGIALGGVSLRDGATLENSGLYGGLWILGSVILSLLIATYSVSRISTFPSARIGLFQGTVVCALFFGIMMMEAATMAGWVASSAGSLLGGAVRGAAAAAPGAGDMLASNNLGLTDLIEDNLQSQANIKFKGDPKTILAGVASRLLRGNTEGAKTYLSRNTNMTPQMIDARLAQIDTQMRAALDQARINAAETLRVSGWSLFGLLVAGLLSSLLGGYLGARANLGRSLETEMVSRRPALRPSYV